jgi:hypothetical protein
MTSWRARADDRNASRRVGLAGEPRCCSGVATLLTSVALLAGYLYLRYVDVVRYSAAQGRVTVHQAGLGTLGTVLVTNKGFALYMFPPDGARRVTCTGGCAFAWPQLKLHAGETVTAGAGVRPGLLGTMPNPGRGRRAISRVAALHLPRRRICRSGQGRRRRVLVRDAPVRADRGLEACSRPSSPEWNPLFGTETSDRIRSAQSRRAREPWQNHRRPR